MNKEDCLKKIVNDLTSQKKTIATMESCTGGAIVNAITNIEGASKILKFSAVTYCNEFKIKFGVEKKIIEQYSVYSIETAREMSQKITIFADADYGIGITGQMNRKDEENPTEDDHTIYISVYDRGKDTYYTKQIQAKNISRSENKEWVLENVLSLIEKNIIS